MGTKAACIKCGKERWVNTTKLKRIHDEFGISPREWLDKKFVCSDCQTRQRMIKAADVDNITARINDFGLECKKIYNGILQSKAQNTNDIVAEKILALLKSNGVDAASASFIKYKKLTIGVLIKLPIVGEFSFIFV